MKINSKDILQLDDLIWLILLIKEESKNKKVIINIDNIQSIVVDYDKKLISITMTNSYLYEIICERDINNWYEKIQRIILDHVVRCTPPRVVSVDNLSNNPCRYY